MPLYKPGKEHTINFIYCWAALYSDLSCRSGPYSFGSRTFWHQTGPERESKERGWCFKSFVSPGSPTEPVHSSWILHVGMALHTK